MVKTASTKPSTYTHKKTTTKIGVVEVGQDFYQSIERLLCSDFEVFSIGFRDILFNNIDVGEYHSILVYYGIKYESIDISATLDLITGQCEVLAGGGKKKRTTSTQEAGNVRNWLI